MEVKFHIFWDMNFKKILAKNVAYDDIKNR